MMCVSTQGGASEWTLALERCVPLLQYLGERLHGERPLRHQLVPAGERRQDREEVVPQVPADVDVEVALYPRHYQSLDGKKMIKKLEMQRY